MPPRTDHRQAAAQAAIAAARPKRVSPAAIYARLHSPDLPEAREGSRDASGGWKINLSGVRRYFVLDLG